MYHGITENLRFHRTSTNNGILQLGLFRLTPKTNQKGSKRHKRVMDLPLNEVISVAWVV